MDMHTGRIISLKIYPEKGSSGIAADCARFVEGQGIQGDHFTGKPSRQISLLDWETRKWMDAQTVTGPCFSRFRENILYDGIAPEQLTEGCRFQIGTGVLAVTQCGKKCFSECDRLQAGLPCWLKESVRYACVEVSGEASTESELIIKSSR